MLRIRVAGRILRSQRTTRWHHDGVWSAALPFQSRGF